MLYNLILIDFPQGFTTFSDKGKGKSPEQHYNVLDFGAWDRLIAALNPIVSKDAILATWVWNPIKVDYAVKVASWKALGWRYATTGFTWAKSQARFKQHDPFVQLHDPRNFFSGTGYYTRQNTEELWFLRRGKGLERKHKGIPQLVVAPRESHSRKPVIFQHYLELLYGDVSRLELFARPPFRAGWTVMGNEVDGQDIFAALEAEKERLNA